MQQKNRQTVFSCKINETQNIDLSYFEKENNKNHYQFYIINSGLMKPTKIQLSIVNCQLLTAVLAIMFFALPVKVIIACSGTFPA